jgi:hypothetical protein
MYIDLHKIMDYQLKSLDLNPIGFIYPVEFKENMVCTDQFKLVIYF